MNLDMNQCQTERRTQSTALAYVSLYTDRQLRTVLYYLCDIDSYTCGFMRQLLSRSYLRFYFSAQSPKKPPVGAKIKSPPTPLSSFIFIVMGVLQFLFYILPKTLEETVFICLYHNISGLSLVVIVSKFISGHDH